MTDCAYTINKEWVVSGTKPILRVYAIDSDGSIIDSIEGTVSLDGLDLPEYARQHGDHVKEDIEKAIEEALIVKLKLSGKV
jgi:hypothetical protein